MAYIIDTVNNITADIEKNAAAAGETVIKFKNKEKKGYYFTAPAVTPAFVQAFMANAKGLEAMQDYVESLVKGVGKKRFDSGLMFSAADCSIDSLVEFAQTTSENVRLTKENIEQAFKEGWQNTIAYALVLDRDAAGAAILLSEDAEAKQAFWSGETGAKFMSIASNYKQFLLYGAERKPAFADATLKEKVLTAISYLDQDEQLVQKLVEKLKEAPVQTVDSLAL